MAWTNNLVQKQWPWVFIHTDTVTDFKGACGGGAQVHHKHYKPSSLPK